MPNYTNLDVLHNDYKHRVPATIIYIQEMIIESKEYLQGDEGYQQHLIKTTEWAPPPPPAFNNGNDTSGLLCTDDETIKDLADHPIPSSDTLLLPTSYAKPSIPIYTNLNVLHHDYENRIPTAVTCMQELMDYLYNELEDPP